MFCSPLGQVGNDISEHTNELIIANYRRIGRAPEADEISFKAKEYPAT